MQFLPLSPIVQPQLRRPLGVFESHLLSEYTSWLLFHDLSSPLGVHMDLQADAWRPKAYAEPLRRRTEQAMFELAEFSEQHCAIYEMILLWGCMCRARRIV